MNILFFNRSFYPDIEATGQFLTELCEDLSELGHEVVVIAGKSQLVQSHKKLFLIQQEKYKLINIIRVNAIGLPKRFLLFRLINLGIYFLLAFIAGFFVKKRPNVVVAQTDPPVTGLIGIFFAKLYKAKFIYSCKDVYPDVGIITGKLTNPILNFLLEKINLLSFKFADKVVCIGEDMKRKIVGKGITQDKIVVIHDWADTTALYPIPPSENPFRVKYNLNDSFIVMYSGNIGLTQGLEQVIEVAKYFKNEKVRFILIGEGANKENLQALVVKYNLSKIEFLSYQPREELKYSLSAADLHLIVAEKGLAGVVVPSKVYGILACGKPFIAWVDEESEICSIAQKYNCGLTVPSGDKDKMVSALEWAVNHKDKLDGMGKNGREVAIKYFDRKVSTGKFNEIIMNIFL